MSQILISDLTSGSLTGDGVFDKLMEASQLRLDDAFNKNRITATDYSTILIQNMANSMQQSIAYLLGVQQADAQAELIKAQKLVTDQELINLQAQKVLLDKQSLEADQQLINSTAQGVLLDKQALEADQQLIHLTAQTAIVTEGLNTSVAETALKEQQLINLQIDVTKVQAETNLVDQNTANALTSNTLVQEQIDKTVAETLLITQNRTNAVTTNQVLGNQVLKVSAETSLLSQKRTTEQAQTQDIADANSMLGKQIALYQKQIDGFDRDAEQKAAKMLLDTWSVRQSTDGADASTAGISDTFIKSTVDKLRAGVDAEGTELTIGYPGAKATAATTGTGTVRVETASGDIYYLVSESASETAGKVLNGAASQAISVAGEQTISFTGLTTATSYYAHYVQLDGSGVVSNVVSSNAFITP